MKQIFKPLEQYKAKLEEWKKARDRAHREICDLASGKKKWEMCIPPQKTDSDFVLQEPLDNLTELIDAHIKAIEALEFYAQPKNWETMDLRNDDNKGYPDYERLDPDKQSLVTGGKTARQALSQITGGET